MSIILISFFVSLIGIIVMTGRKFVLLKNGKMIMEEKVAFEGLNIDKTKNLIIENIKRYEHMALVEILRIYVKVSNSLKSKYYKIKERIINIHKINHINSEKKEMSKFLKIIRDYKDRIREIKHKIKKEENL